MKITARVAAYLIATAFYISLVLSDSYLYENLPFVGILSLSLLRFFLIAIPLLSGIFLIKKPASRFRAIVWIVWLFFLPYTIYSATEIRHVSESCRLTTTYFYTESCVAHAWHLLPLFSYALVGTLAYVFSVTTVYAYFIKNSNYKRLCILLTCFYAALASVFGLYTRINVWNILFEPATVLSAFRTTMLRPDFFENVVIFTIFFSAITFAIRRAVQHLGKWM